MLFWDNRDFCQDLLRRSRDFSRRSWDLSRNLDIVEAFWVWKWWKVSTDWEISTRKYKNPRTSRLRQIVKKRRNFQISTNFSIAIETFWSGRWCRDKIEKSRSSRLTFWRCRDFLDCRDKSRQIETPKAIYIRLYRFCRVLAFATFAHILMLTNV